MCIHKIFSLIAYFGIPSFSCSLRCIFSVQPASHSFIHSPHLHTPPFNHFPIHPICLRMYTLYIYNYKSKEKEFVFTFLLISLFRKILLKTGELNLYLTYGMHYCLRFTSFSPYTHLFSFSILIHSLLFPI